MSITLRLLAEPDIKIISLAFNPGGQHRSKQPAQYERYLAEQARGERVVLMAHFDGEFAGYGTIQWQSGYKPFAERGIPEVTDLNVLPQFRRLGIAKKLVDEAERRIFERSPVAGIGVGMYADYGPAQRMYVLRGYVPDGRGVFHGDQPLAPGREVFIDDSLVMYLTKERGKVGSEVEDHSDYRRRAERQEQLCPGTCREIRQEGALCRHSGGRG